jgi:hypothetical protein
MPAIKKAVIKKDPENNRINVAPDEPFLDSGSHITLLSQESCSRCLSYKFVIDITTGVVLEIPEGCIAITSPCPHLVAKGVRFSTQVIHDSGPVTIPVELKNGAIQTEIAPGQPFCCLYIVSLTGFDYSK